MCARIQGIDLNASSFSDFDTGGPLLTADGEFLYGINSFAVGCGFPDSEGIYTRISAFQLFIEESICEMSNDRPASCLEETEPVPTPGPFPMPAQTPTVIQPGQGESTPTLSMFPTMTWAPNTLALFDLPRPKMTKREKRRGKGKKSRSGKESYKKSASRDQSSTNNRDRSGIFQPIKGKSYGKDKRKQDETHTNIFGMM